MARRQPGAPSRRRIPLRFKLPLTAFFLVWVPAYWVEYGPANFLWGSDVALIVTFIAVWTESRLLASMMATGFVLVEVGWMIDFALRLALGPDAIAIGGTRYMFNGDIALWIRGLSLFHVALPIMLLWLAHRLGYERRALVGQTLLTWVILPITYLVTDPAANINWVYGFGPDPQTWLPERLYVVLLMVLYPLALYLPSHLLLRRLFPDRNNHDDN